MSMEMLQMIRRMIYAGSLVAVAVGAVGCNDDPNAPIEEAALLSVIPSGGATDVDPNTPITVEFDHMMQGDMYVTLHEGDMTGPFGPEVAGTWSWSQDRMHLMFTPAAPLKGQTEYTIHVGGGMRGDNGSLTNLERHGMSMGGEWVTQQMMQGCMMQVCGDMMGPGWQHSNGSFGMSFTFTTA